LQKKQEKVNSSLKEVTAVARDVVVVVVDVVVADFG
jgi:hypothetical protein